MVKGKGAGQDGSQRPWGRRRTYRNYGSGIGVNFDLLTLS
jgi:hypothetical protein